MKMKGIMMIALLSFSISAMAQSKKFEEVQIKTSAVCGMCEKTIEEALLYTKGVKEASLDVPTAMVTVKYRADKTDLDKIKAAINAVGYTADDQKPSKEAYDALHECCKAPHD
jgi:periplasmic mercuric ion binding protein